MCLRRVSAEGYRYSSERIGSAVNSSSDSQKKGPGGWNQDSTLRAHAVTRCYSMATYFVCPIAALLSSCITAIPSSYLHQGNLFAFSSTLPRPAVSHTPFASSFLSMNWADLFREDV